MGDQRDLHPDRADADRQVHHLGPAVLAGHRRLLQGPRKRSGVGVAGRAAAVGDGVGAHRRAAQLSDQRPVRSAADGDRRCGRGQRGGQRLWDTRLLVLDGDVRHPRHDPHRPIAAGPLPDAALHHPLAGVAHRPAHRRLAGPTVPTTAGASSTSTIDNPDQRIQQDIDVFTTGTGPETNTPTSGRRRRCCSARSTRSCRWCRSRRSCGICPGR